MRSLIAGMFRRPETLDKNRAISRGFTIVELLIVIVVIGILAAITIIAYNGISSKATVASLQSDLENSNKQMLADVTTSSTGFPTAIDCSSSPAANTICLKTSGTTTYQYSVDNSSLNNPSYCITATNGTKSYYIGTSVSAPTIGGCPGHGAGGVAAVTNMVFNPAAISSFPTEWKTRYAMVSSWITNASDGPITGLASYFRATQPTATSGAGRGIDYRINVELTNPTVDTTWPVTAGTPTSVSVYVRSSIDNTGISLRYRLHDGAGNWTGSATVCNTSSSYTANTWIRLTCTFTPATSGYVATGSYIPQSVAWTVGSTIDSTGLFITNGSTIYPYSDPTTNPKWVWNGTPNSSTSIGPAV